MSRPTARRSAAAVLRDGEFWMIGGFGVGGTTRPDDISAAIWIYRDGHWRRDPNDAAPAARYPGIVLANEALWRFGGCGWDGSSITFLNDVSVYRSRDEGWLSAPTVPDADQPQERYANAMAAAGDGFVVFGGYSQHPDGSAAYLGDLWHFSADRWSKLHDTGPGPGARYAFGWCTSSDSLYLFGGFDGNEEKSDLWKLDLSAAAQGTVSWTQLPSPERARYCPAMGATEAGLVLFGGRSKLRPRDNYDDTWIFDLSEEKWRPFDGASPPYHAKPACASDGSAMLMFGGEGRHGHVSDLWRFDGSGWRQLEAPSADDPIQW